MSNADATKGGVVDYDEDSAVESDYEEEKLEYVYDRVARLCGGSYGSALKKGISLAEVTDKGASFEIDTDKTGEDLPGEDTEGYFDEKSLRFARYDLVNGDDSSTTSDDDSLQSDIAFEEIAKDALDISPNNSRGVLKKIVSEGFGKVIPVNAFVRMHYNAYTELSPEPFDSSRLRNIKQKLRLNEGRTIEGLEIALSSMKKGEKALFLIEPEFAFGHLGVPPRIPPMATLLYEIELIDFAEGTAAVEMMSPEEREEEMGFRKIMKLGRGLMAYGIRSMKASMMQEASDKFNRGIRLLESMNLKDGNEEYERDRLLIKFYNNMALVQDEKGNMKRVAYFSRSAIKLDETCCKALYRLGRALVVLHDYEEARKFLMRARTFAPKDENILKELEYLAQRAHSAKQQEKAFAMAAFGSKPKAKAAATPVASKDFCDEAENVLKDFVASSREECLIPGEMNIAEFKFISETATSLGLAIAKTDITGVLVVKGTT